MSGEPPPGFTAEDWAAVEKAIDKNTYTAPNGERVVDVDALNGAEVSVLVDLARRAHEASVAKGFDPPRWVDETIVGSYADTVLPANYLAKLMLVVTELDEVMRSAGVTAIGEELADVVLRVLPMLHCCHDEKWLGDLDLLVRERKTPLMRTLRPHTWNEIGVLIRMCVQAAEAWRKDDRTSAALALHNLVLATFFFADTCGVDLFAAVEAKMAKNAARPHRHGKKSTG